MRLERALHDGSLRLVMRSQSRRDAIDDAAGERAVDDALIEDAAGNVAACLQSSTFCAIAAARPSTPRAGRDQDLREASEVDHAVVRVVGLDRRVSSNVVTSSK
jgi:hypothetical protein